MWDTAGQERFRTITQTYYKGAMGIILVYDCCDENSFNNIRNWIKQIETHAASDVVKVLVGNKADMDDERVVTTEQGQQLAEECGLPFFETSAKTGLNISELFYDIGSRIVATRPKPVSSTRSAEAAGDGKRLSNMKQKKSSDGGCCN